MLVAQTGMGPVEMVRRGWVLDELEDIPDRILLVKWGVRR